MERKVTAVGTQVFERPAASEISEFAGAVIELRDLQRRMEALASRLMAHPPSVEARQNRTELEPEVDIYENDQEFLIQAAVPGVPPQKIVVEVASHSVTLVAETYTPRRGDEAGEPDGNTKRHRRSRQSDHERFRFVYTLHSAVLPESVRAVFRHGIVEIHLPKVRTQQMFVTVPVVLHDDASALNELPSRLVGLPTPATEIVVVSAHEGSPRHKLGAAYAPNAGEDHAAKAQSVGESRVPGRATTTLPARQMDPDNAQSQAAVRQGHSEQKR